MNRRTKTTTQSNRHPKRNIGLVVSIISVVVTVIGLTITWNAFRTSKQAYEAVIEPVLDYRFAINNNEHEVALILVNAGAVAIDKISIEKHRARFQEGNKLKAAMWDDRSWKYFDRLLPGDSLVARLDSTDINGSIEFL
jgi:hypothetical protein